MGGLSEYRKFIRKYKKKAAKDAESALLQAQIDLFWVVTLHGGRYKKVQPKLEVLLEELKKAYSEDSQEQYKRTFAHGLVTVVQLFKSPALRESPRIRGLLKRIGDSQIVINASVKKSKHPLVRAVHESTKKLIVEAIKYSDEVAPFKNAYLNLNNTRKALKEAGRNTPFEDALCRYSKCWQVMAASIINKTQDPTTDNCGCCAGEEEDDDGMDGFVPREKLFDEYDEEEEEEEVSRTETANPIDEDDLNMEPSSSRPSTSGALEPPNTSTESSKYTERDYNNFMARISEESPPSRCKSALSTKRRRTSPASGTPAAKRVSFREPLHQEYTFEVDSYSSEHSPADDYTDEPMEIDEEEEGGAPESRDGARDYAAQAQDNFRRYVRAVVEEAKGVLGDRDGDEDDSHELGIRAGDFHGGTGDEGSQGDLEGGLRDGADDEDRGTPAGNSQDGALPRYEEEERDSEDGEGGLIIDEDAVQDAAIPADESQDGPTPGAPGVLLEAPGTIDDLAGDPEDSDGGLIIDEDGYGSDGAQDAAASGEDSRDVPRDREDRTYEDSGNDDAVDSGASEDAAVVLEDRDEDSADEDESNDHQIPAGVTQDAASPGRVGVDPSDSGNEDDANPGANEGTREVPEESHEDMEEEDAFREVELPEDIGSEVHAHSQAPACFADSGLGDEDDAQEDRPDPLANDDATGVLEESSSGALEDRPGGSRNQASGATEDSAADFKAVLLRIKKEEPDEELEVLEGSDGDRGRARSSRANDEATVDFATLRTLSIKKEEPEEGDEEGVLDCRTTGYIALEYTEERDVKEMKFDRKKVKIEVFDESEDSCEEIENEDYEVDEDAVDVENEVTFLKEVPVKADVFLSCSICEKTFPEPAPINQLRGHYYHEHRVYRSDEVLEHTRTHRMSLYVSKYVFTEYPELQINQRLLLLDFAASLEYSTHPWLISVIFSDLWDGIKNMGEGLSPEMKRACENSTSSADHAEVVNLYYLAAHLDKRKSNLSRVKKIYNIIDAASPNAAKKKLSKAKRDYPLLFRLEKEPTRYFLSFDANVIEIEGGFQSAVLSMIATYRLIDAQYAKGCEDVLQYLYEGMGIPV